MEIPTIRAAVVAAALCLSGCAAVMASNEPARNDALVARVQQGMTQAEVRAILGPPDETMPFPLSGSLSWDYRMYDGWGYMVRYSVTFGPDGRVASKIAQRLNDGGGRGQ